MATSIADLLTTIDQRTHRQPIEAADAAHALHYSGRILARLHADGLGRDYPPACGASLRRLGECCSNVATTFDQQAGPISDLVGVLGDAISTLHGELVEADRWLIATALAPIARRCTVAIRDGGPYAQVPEILSAIDRAGELQRAAAATPPDPARCRGLDAPIPTTWIQPGLSSERRVLEATAALTAEFRRRDRPTATVRELIAVCHVASRVADHLGIGAAADGSDAAEAWRQARTDLAAYTDGRPLPPPGQPRSRLLIHAMRVEAAIHRSETEPERLADTSARLRGAIAADAGRYLGRIANACHAELGRLLPTLVVRPGQAPLNEHRVGEWLRHEPFRAGSRDLDLVVIRLQELAAGRIGLAYSQGVLILL